jgi:ATP-dependent Clp protease protease subunit
MLRLPKEATMTRHAEEPGHEHDESPTKLSDLGRLADKMLEARTIIVSEEVTDGLHRRVATLLTLMELQDAKAPVKVLINSPGGSADSGFAIYDLLRFAPYPVITVGNGVVASAAVLIFLGAQKGRRLSLPNARFLLHQPSASMRGQASDIDITAREIMKLRRRYNEIVAEVTGKSLDQIEKDSDRDFWLSAPEAVEYKLADRVITRRSELEEAAKR